MDNKKKYTKEHYLPLPKHLSQSKHNYVFRTCAEWLKLFKMSDELILTVRIIQTRI